jgi:hypothetical protein
MSDVSVVRCRQRHYDPVLPAVSAASKQPAAARRKILTHAHARSPRRSTNTQPYDRPSATIFRVQRAAGTEPRHADCHSSSAELPLPQDSPPPLWLHLQPAGGQLMCAGRPRSMHAFRQIEQDSPAAAAPCIVAQYASGALARCHGPPPFFLLGSPPSLSRTLELRRQRQRQRPASQSRTTSDAFGRRGSRGGTVAWPARGPSQPPRWRRLPSRRCPMSAPSPSGTRPEARSPRKSRQFGPPPTKAPNREESRQLRQESPDRDRPIARSGGDRAELKVAGDTRPRRQNCLLYDKSSQGTT